MPFRVSGLSAEPFRHLYGLANSELLARGAHRYTVDKTPGFPDRIELRDMTPGETALLVNYTHQGADTPYRASHAIFVREGAEQTRSYIDEIPQVMLGRMLSLRAFDAAHMMVDATLVDGRQARDAVERLLSDDAVAYIQAHYALRGCYAARIERQ
jgi:Protein of unknown function (DUF1203)